MLPSQSLKPDLDLDGSVGFSDFLILSANFGRTDEDVSYSEGDIDGDGQVQFSDFLILSANFGSTTIHQVGP